MENFDIETAKSDLVASKRHYAELLELYSQLKSQAHPQQHFPSIEMKLHEVEESIQTHTNMIANYEDLVFTMKQMQAKDEEILEELRRVRAKYE
jgi:hypothetical protein